MRAGRSVAARYGVALALVGLAFAIVRALHPILDVGSFSIFLAAVAASAAFGGMLPGLASTVLAIALLDFFFLLPLGTLAVVARTDLILLVTLASTALVVTWLTGLLERAKRRAEERAMQSAAVSRLLERHMHDLETDVDTLKTLSSEQVPPRRSLN
jgi:K+-sensing histidine kinase KdpD